MLKSADVYAASIMIRMHLSPFTKFHFFQPFLGTFWRNKKKIGFLIIGFIYTCSHWLYNGWVKSILAQLSSTPNPLHQLTFSKANNPRTNTSWWMFYHKHFESFHYIISVFLSLTLSFCRLARLTSLITLAVTDASGYVRVTNCNTL